MVNRVTCNEIAVTLWKMCFLMGESASTKLKSRFSKQDREINDIVFFLFKAAMMLMKPV